MSVEKSKMQFICNDILVYSLSICLTDREKIKLSLCSKYLLGNINNITGSDTWLYKQDLSILDIETFIIWLERFRKSFIKTNRIKFFIEWKKKTIPIIKLLEKYDRYDLISILCI